MNTAEPRYAWPVTAAPCRRRPSQDHYRITGELNRSSVARTSQRKFRRTSRGAKIDPAGRPVEGGRARGRRRWIPDCRLRPVPRLVPPRRKVWHAGDEASHGLWRSRSFILTPRGWNRQLRPPVKAVLHNTPSPEGGHAAMRGCATSASGSSAAGVWLLADVPLPVGELRTILAVFRAVKVSFSSISTSVTHRHRSRATLLSGHALGSLFQFRFRSPGEEPHHATVPYSAPPPGDPGRRLRDHQRLRPVPRAATGGPGPGPRRFSVRPPYHGSEQDPDTPAPASGTRDECSMPYRPPARCEAWPRGSGSNGQKCLLRQLVLQTYFRVPLSRPAPRCGVSAATVNPAGPSPPGADRGLVSR